MDLVLYALVIADIDPNITTHMSPLSWAAQCDWVEGISILLECGADPNVCDGAWGGPPLYRTGSYNVHVSEAGHYLLLNGADPLGHEWRGLDSWGKVITNACDAVNDIVRGTSHFQYISFEGSITHLLFHGSDPFEVFTTVPSDNDYWPNIPKWFDRLAQMRASDVARIWCTHYHALRSRWATPNYKAESNYEMEISEGKTPSWKFEWDAMGGITGRYVY